MKLQIFHTEPSTQNVLIILRAFPELEVQFNGKCYRRRGNCRMCGECCHSERLGATFSATCKHLRDGKCTIFGKPERPIACSLFPLTPGDLESLPNCGYSFECIEP